jgi:transcription initiation factor TFIIH subunit 4
MTYSGPIPFQEVRTWFLLTHKAIQNKTLWRLKQLQILQGRGQEVWINEAFQKSLFSGFSQGIIKIPSISSFKELDDFAISKWELVLYELVKGENQQHDSKRVKSTISPLEKLLKDSELVSNSGRVTNSGFQFLLKDVSNQIWILLIHYLKNMNDMTLVQEYIEFIGEQVLFGRPGVPIIERSKINLSLFEQFGLLMRKSSIAICPTRLFTSLSGSKNSLDFSQNGAESRGFLVVETNYRVYAYTSSPLQIAILALFIRLQDRFPNLVYGQLDMETVQNAMAHGISADQIIQYLQINVHPCMFEGKGSGSGIPFNGIPFTIIDQIKLWELNRNRLAHREGFLYQQFLSEREFEAALSEAKAINALLYAKPTSRLLIVSSEGHDHMKQFLKSIK